MASKSKWKKRAAKRSAKIEVLVLELEATRKIAETAEYHRLEHGKATLELQMATTSPDTKAAHELGYRNGFTAGSSRGFDTANLEREIDHALLPALQHCARLEQEVVRANQALNTSYQRIDVLFNPPPEDVACETSLSTHPKPVGVEGGEFPPETGRA